MPPFFKNMVSHLIIISNQPNETNITVIVLCFMCHFFNKLPLESDINLSNYQVTRNYIVTFRIMISCLLLIFLYFMELGVLLYNAKFNIIRHIQSPIGIEPNVSTNIDQCDYYTMKRQTRPEISGGRSSLCLRGVVVFTLV